MKKKMTHFDGSSLGSLQSDSGSVSPMPVPDAQTHSEMPGSLFAAPPPPAALPMGALQHGGSLQQVVASQWACGGATVAPSPRSGTGALQHPGSDTAWGTQASRTLNQEPPARCAAQHELPGAMELQESLGKGMPVPQGALRPGAAGEARQRRAQEQPQPLVPLQTQKKAQNLAQEISPTLLRQLCPSDCPLPSGKETIPAPLISTGSMYWSHLWTLHMHLEKCKPGWCVLSRLMESLEPGGCTHYMLRAKVRDKLFGIFWGLTGMISNAPYTGINRHSSVLL